MTRLDYGTVPTAPNEVVRLGDLYTNFPSYSQTISSGANFTVTLPASPIDHTMFLLEVDASADITVSLPVGVQLMTGTTASNIVPNGTVAFFGFRYSATRGSWFFLSSTVQI